MAALVLKEVNTDPPPTDAPPDLLAAAALVRFFFNLLSAAITSDVTEADVVVRSEMEHLS